MIDAHMRKQIDEMDATALRRLLIPALENGGKLAIENDELRQELERHKAVVENLGLLSTSNNRQT